MARAEGLVVHAQAEPLRFQAHQALLDQRGEHLLVEPHALEHCGVELLAVHLLHALALAHVGALELARGDGQPTDLGQGLARGPRRRRPGTRARTGR